METSIFDSGKSIEGLAQFDQAAANSALMFSANFITQVDALSASLLGMADTAAAALTAAFSTGAAAMSESVGTSILNITTKIQEMQVLATESLAIFSENAIMTFLAISENFILQADGLNILFAEIALAMETSMVTALANIELAFVTSFANILTELTTKQEEMNAILTLIGENMAAPFTAAETAFITAFSNILTELETKRGEIEEKLLEIETLFSTTSENAQLSFMEDTTIIKEAVVSVETTTVASNTNVIASIDQVSEKEEARFSLMNDGIPKFNSFYKLLENIQDLMQNGIPIIGKHTSAMSNNSVAVGKAGSVSGGAALKVLEFGAGILMVGGGVLLAGMALVLLAKAVFNFFKMLGNPTNGVKASDFDMKFEVPGLANGGIPGYGELFVAREAGPEFVGSFGSRNVVMNNDQIVAAVSGGVYDAVRRANAEQTQQPIYLNVEAKVRENVLFDMMETVKAERGVRLATGGAW